MRNATEFEVSFCVASQRLGEAVALANWCVCRKGCRRATLRVATVMAQDGCDVDLAGSSDLEDECAHRTLLWKRRRLSAEQDPGNSRCK